MHLCIDGLTSILITVTVQHLLCHLRAALATGFSHLWTLKLVWLVVARDAMWSIYASTHRLLLALQVSACSIADVHGSSKDLKTPGLLICYSARCEEENMEVLDLLVAGATRETSKLDTEKLILSRMCIPVTLLNIQGKLVYQNEASRAYMVRH